MIWMLFFFVITQAWADVQVQATVDRNQVGVGDVINYSISVSSGDSLQIDEPSLGQLDGFEIINTSTGVETRSSFVNGRFITEQSRSFNYMLAVNKKGNLTIPSVAVNVSGKTYKTNPISIAATGERSIPPQAQNRPRGMPDPFEQIDEMEELFNQMMQRRFRPDVPGQQQIPVNPEEAFFIHAEADKTKAYVGEQVTVTFYLYTRGQIRDIDTLKYPDLKGFWKEDLEMATRLNFEQVVVNGIAYQRALLVSYALFPIKPGKATIDSYKAKCTVLTPSNFGFGRPYQFTKASKPISVEVAEVPVDNRPANFTGAVGNFRVRAQFEPPTGTTNQPITLRARVEGLGNAKLVELPKLDMPPSFEIHDQKSNAKFLKDGSSFKEFEVLIIPREPGVFDLPALSIATFDPQAKKFVQVASQPLKVTVTGAASQMMAQTGQTGGVSTSPSSTAAGPSGPRLPPLATEFESSASVASTAKPIVTLLLYLGVFGFLGQQSWMRFRQKPKRASLSLSLKMRTKKVRELAAKKDWRKAGVEMTNAVYHILGHLTDLGGANQDLAKLLEHAPPSLRNELSEPIKDLLSKCEALSFAPEELIKDMISKEQPTRLIAEFEKLMYRVIEFAET